MATSRRTGDITFGGWTTIQMSLEDPSQFSDTAPLDDLGGPGPYLVLDRGIWKYPTQTSGGRIVIPSRTGRPVRITSVMGDLGDAAATWALHVAGYDGTAGRPDNTTGEPYDAGDAPLYREGDVVVAGDTGQYVALSLDPTGTSNGGVVFPGQSVYVVTTGAVAPLIRISFKLAIDSQG